MQPAAEVRRVARLVAVGGAPLLTLLTRPDAERRGALLVKGEAGQTAQPPMPPASYDVTAL
eukprot:12737001-Prorocentrum_lima.AAC.1